MLLSSVNQDRWLHYQVFKLQIIKFSSYKLSSLQVTLSSFQATNYQVFKRHIKFSSDIQSLQATNYQVFKLQIINSTSYIIKSTSYITKSSSYKLLSLQATLQSHQVITYTYIQLSSFQAANYKVIKLLLRACLERSFDWVLSYQRKFMWRLMWAWHTLLFLTFDFHVHICSLNQIFSFLLRIDLDTTHDIIFDFHRDERCKLHTRYHCKRSASRKKQDRWQFVTISSSARNLSICDDDVFNAIFFNQQWRWFIVYNTAKSLAQSFARLIDTRSNSLSKQIARRSTRVSKIKSSECEVLLEKDHEAWRLHKWNNKKNLHETKVLLRKITKHDVFVSWMTKFTYSIFMSTKRLNCRSSSSKSISSWICENE